MVEVDINDVVGNRNVAAVTIHVTGMRRFNLRLKLATMLLRVAAWVAPIGMTVETDFDA